MFGFNINFGGMGDKLEVFDCMIDVEINGNKQRQRMQAPRIMIEQQFSGICQEIARMNAPATAKLSRIAKCYSEWNDNVVEREVYILFENNACCDNYGNN